MSSDKAKWDTKFEISLKDYYSAPWYVPHKGFVNLIRELEKTLGTEAAHNIVSKVREETVTEFYRKLKGDAKIESLIDFFNTMMSIIASGVRCYKHAVEGVPHESPGYDAASKATSCIWAEVYKEWDAVDVGYLWECMSDFTGVKALSPDVYMKMPKCMMLGDDECIWVYKWIGDS